jgi:flagellar basal body-associated protein FliL
MQEGLQLAENLSPQALAVLIGVGVAVAAILLLRFAKQIAIFLLIAGVLVAIIAVCFALASQSEATRQTAQAAKVSSVGQTANSVAMTVMVILLVLVVLAAGGGMLYLYIRMRRAESQTGAKGWAPGPNARWGRKDNQPALPATGAPDPMAQMFYQMQQMQMFMMTEMMTLVREMRGHSAPRYSMPPSPPAEPTQNQVVLSRGWWPKEYDGENR